MTTNSIERNLLLLAGGALGLFVTLTVALFVVQATMASQFSWLQGTTLPVQQDVARLDSEIAAAFAREADGLSTLTAAELEPMRDGSAIQAALEGSVKSLRGHVKPMGDAELAKRVESIGNQVHRFVASDEDVFDSLARGHTLDATFRTQLAARNGDLREEVTRVRDVAGRLKLTKILVLRRVVQGAGGLDEITTGDVRAREEAAQDLQGSIQRYAMLVAQIGNLEGPDALNSHAANELPQAESRTREDLGELGDLTAGDQDVFSRVQAIASGFDSVVKGVVDRGDPKSLLSLRYARFDERKRTAQIRADSVAIAQNLLAVARDVQTGVDQNAARTQGAVRSRSVMLLFGSIFLTVLGAALCAFAARRIAESVAELRLRNQRLVDLQAELQKVNEDLEQKVAQRTADLARRERSLQLVLDSTGDGLLTVDLDGVLRPERSHTISNWFAGANDAKLLWDLLFQGDARASGFFQASFSQLAAGLLPFDVAVDQMPHQIERAGRALTIDYRSVTEHDATSSLLVTIRDVTEQRAAARAERDARDMQTVLANVLRDPSGFRRAVHDLRDLTNTAVHGRNPAEVRRALHTLKGNAGLCGFGPLAALVHAVEESMAESGEEFVDPSEAAELMAVLRSSVDRAEEFLGPSVLNRLEVSVDDLEALLRLVRERRDHAEIARLALRWRLEPAARPLEALAMQAKRLAARLGKEVSVTVDAGLVRTDPEALSVIWSNLVHAVRNAVDHGIEDAKARIAAGKSPRGRLLLRAFESELALTIEVIDDGAGIDLERVRVAARMRGLRSETEADLVEAIFDDGLSTKTEATEISGRGVGMSALRHACRSLGGTVAVSTITGGGTTLRIELPIGAARLAAA